MAKTRRIAYDRKRSRTSRDTPGLCEIPQEVSQSVTVYLQLGHNIAFTLPS
ncbi:hypothetical protein [Pseudanabaena sp. PCC 6802]|uniref:hypothetical protein n=1 Tax=Pseudanabaena sp. PCC 6802 TaxID=118173 RepID=UPI00034CC9F6|nr:hypothetical protein [Pseudanabaena sp. PCC 6802]